MARALNLRCSSRLFFLQAPSVKKRRLGRRSGGFRKNDFPLFFGVVEEAVEVNVVHKCNPYHCGQPGKTPFPRKTFLHHHQQQVCNQRHPYLDFDGVGAFAIKVFQRKMTQPSFLQLSSNRASSKPSINSQISIPKKWSFGQFFGIGWLKQLCHKRQTRCKLLLST